MTLEIQLQSWDRHKNMGRLQWLMGPQPSPLDNWISNGNTYINKRKKPAQIRFHSKRLHTITTK
jgi:hypothetical protein